jgi:geranylgeranyl diphosphate synthase type I
MRGEFSPAFEELRQQVEDELSCFLLSRRDANSEAALLVDEMIRLLSAGGKRLRPAFCYWGYRAGGGNHGVEIVRAAASLELLHTFALVHDDIMDGADERRGQPTVHALHGLDVALLVGDLALVLADDLFINCGFPPGRVMAGFDAYSRMRREVIAGQFLDVMVTRREVVTEAEARRIAVLKSGRYTVQEPLLIGAALAGAAPETQADLASFGDPLGEAFQLRDDLLGTFGERSSVGKPVDSDIREGKRNVLYAKALAALQGEDRRFFLSCWGGGDSLAAQDVERLRKLVESSGARDSTEALLSELAGRAEGALGRCRLTPEGRHALEALARLAINRDV